MSAPDSASSTCKLALLGEQQLSTLLNSTLEGLSEPGLRQVVNGILLLLYRSKATGRSVHALAGETLADPLTEGVLHVHEHLVVHMLRQEEEHPGLFVAAAN